jgi:hypothetical protein
MKRYEKEIRPERRSGLSRLTELKKLLQTAKDYFPIMSNNYDANSNSNID